MNIIGYNQSGIQLNKASKLYDSFFSVRPYELKQINGVSRDQIRFDCRKNRWLVMFQKLIGCHCLIFSQKQSGKGFSPSRLRKCGLQ